MSGGSLRARVVTYDPLGDPVRVTKLFTLPSDWTGPDVMDRLEDADTEMLGTAESEEVYVAVVDEDWNEISGSDL
jgi:hypothetical protein